MAKSISNLKFFLIIINFIFLLFPVFLVRAGNLSDAFGSDLETMASSSGYDASQATSSSLEDRVGLIIQTALSLLGVLFIILIIYGGIIWLTAAGNEESVKKAVSTIKHAFIGLVIVLLAYIVSIFVIKIFIN